MQYKNALVSFLQEAAEKLQKAEKDRRIMEEKANLWKRPVGLARLVEPKIDRRVTHRGRGAFCDLDFQRRPDETSHSKDKESETNKADNHEEVIPNKDQETVKDDKENDGTNIQSKFSESMVNPDQRMIHKGGENEIDAHENQENIKGNLEQTEESGRAKAFVDSGVDIDNGLLENHENDRNKEDLQDESHRNLENTTDLQTQEGKTVSVTDNSVDKILQEPVTFTEKSEPTKSVSRASSNSVSEDSKTSEETVDNSQKTNTENILKEQTEQNQSILESGSKSFSDESKVDVNTSGDFQNTEKANKDNDDLSIETNTESLGVDSKAPDPSKLTSDSEINPDTDTVSKTPEKEIPDSEIIPDTDAESKAPDELKTMTDSEINPDTDAESKRPEELKVITDSEGNPDTEHVP